MKGNLRQLFISNTGNRIQAIEMTGMDLWILNSKKSHAN